MVVEDEDSIREVLKMVLELEGYTVLSVANGLEALRALGTSPIRPSVILLDLMMPVMNGWQFLEEKNKTPAFASIPVIIVTAFREKAATIQADDVVLKPIDFDQLMSAIRRQSARAA